MSKELYVRLIEKYGENMQCIVAMEEMAELQKELSKAIRGKQDINHIIEEIADVEIMLEQLKLIFRCENAVQEYKLSKLEKTRGKLEGDGL